MTSTTRLNRYTFEAYNTTRDGIVHPQGTKTFEACNSEEAEEMAWQDAEQNFGKSVQVYRCF